MKLFVGLGNPGAKYAGHRHNIGFMAADAVHRAHAFPPWRKKFRAEVAEGVLGGEKVWLVKPQTFMNLSGQAVGEAMRYLKLDPGDIWVFHDELDLAPGKVRVKTGGGHAGHNGLRSLHQHVGPDHHRVRLGIGHPGSKELVTTYVLHDFAKEDRAWLEPLMDAVGREAPRLAAGDASGFMSAVAMAVRPPDGRKSEGGKPAKGAAGAKGEAAPRRAGRNGGPAGDGARDDGPGGHGPGGHGPGGHGPGGDARRSDRPGGDRSEGGGAHDGRARKDGAPDTGDDGKASRSGGIFAKVLAKIGRK